MENKKVGYLLLGVSILIIILVILFNSALKEIVSISCGEVHGAVCPMNQTINQQTYLALGVVGLLIIISLVLIFSKPEEKIIVKKIKQKSKHKKIDLSKLDEKEKKVILYLKKEGATFQAELKEKLGIGKVGLTRLLDKLEAKQLIERKRRGMNNIVSLK
jgi:uncharacterized membrane protein